MGSMLIVLAIAGIYAVHRGRVLDIAEQSTRAPIVDVSAPTSTSNLDTGTATATPVAYTYRDVTFRIVPILDANSPIGSFLRCPRCLLGYLISLTNTSPIFYRGAKSLQMGSANLALFPELKASNKDPNGQLATLKKTFADRSLPSGLASFYAQTFLLNDLANANIAAGGKGTPGPTNATQLPFLQYLIDRNIGDVYYLYADGTYDFHADEEPKFDTQIKDLMKGLTTVLNAESRRNQKLTIVLFSEFGRTDKTNGNDGTDHGIGGGMLVMSNVLRWPTMIGSLQPSTDANNWTDVVVDERDVWDTLFNSLYSVPVDKIFGRTQTIQSYPVTIPSQ